MPDAPSPSPCDDVRDRVAVCLVLLAAGPRGLHAFRPDLPPDAAAFALCRLWFDDVYTPGLSYLDGLKGDRSKHDADHFLECFDDEEQAALERFHRFFELRMQMLPAEARRRQVFPDGDPWRQLMRDARYLVEDLVPDPAALRRRMKLAPEDTPLIPDAGRAPGTR